MTARRMLNGRCECRTVRYRVPDEFFYAASFTRRTAIARIAGQVLARPSRRSRHRAGEGGDSAGIRLAARLGRRRSQPHTLWELRLASLLGRSRRCLRPRRHGLTCGRARDSTDRAHIRRLESALVRNHGRPSTIRRVLVDARAVAVWCRTPPRRALSVISYGLKIGYADRTQELSRAFVARLSGRRFYEGRQRLGQARLRFAESADGRGQ